MEWAHMAVSGTGPLNFTDDSMYDDSSRMNLEGYKTILPTNIQANATRFTGKCFILDQDNDPKHPACLRLPKPISRFKSDWTLISPAEEESKGRNSQDKQQLNLAAIMSGTSISKDETKSLVMSMGHRLTAVIVHKGSATQL